MEGVVAITGCAANERVGQPACIARRRAVSHFSRSWGSRGCGVLASAMVNVLVRLMGSLGCVSLRRAGAKDTPASTAETVDPRRQPGKCAG